MNRYPTLAGVALIVVASFVLAPSANAQFGIAAGANFEDLGDLTASDGRASFDQATGYHIGLFFNLGAGRFSVQPGVFMRDFGDVTIVEEGRFRTFSLTSIEIPVDIRIRLLPGRAVAPFVFAGPVVGFATTTDDSFEDVLRDLTISANVGGGIEIDVPSAGITLIPEVRFARSVTRFFEEGTAFDIAGVDFTATEVSAQQAVMLRLGLRF